MADHKETDPQAGLGTPAMPYAHPVLNGEQKRRLFTQAARAIAFANEAETASGANQNPPRESPKVS